MGLRTYGRERIRDNGNKQINKPEIENNDADDEIETGDEEFGIDHRVHKGRPLLKYTSV